MLHRFEIHSALELSRPALLVCRLAALRLREAARWQLPWDVLIFFLIGGVTQYQCLRSIKVFDIGRLCSPGDSRVLPFQIVFFIHRNFSVAFLFLFYAIP